MIAKRIEEIEILREGGRRLARHVRILSEMIKPGISVHALETRANEMVLSDDDALAFYDYPAGKKGELFPSGLIVSMNDVIVHAPAIGDGVIEDGDVVSLDFGIRHKGLYTDHAVTVIAGTPKSADDERLVRGTQEALAVGIATARMGSTVGDIGAAIEETAKKYNFGFPRNLSGHGVGKKVHEEPHVPNFGTRGKGELLTEGLVIAIEPMMALGSGELYIDADGFSYRTRDHSRTAHFEHTIIITRDGPDILTKE